MRAHRIRIVLAASAAALAMIAPSAGSASHSNLLPNAGFERSAFEPAPVPTCTLAQPLLPEGWIFEGSAGLFDHYPRDSGGRETNDGCRGIQISAPASGKRQICADPPVGCHPNPANLAKDQLASRGVYDVDPHWRNAVPVAVTGATSYRLSAWTQMDIVTTDEGASARVRWLDANRVPIGETSVWTRRVSATDPGTIGQIKSGTTTSPPNARFAIVLLGHTADLWIGGVRFDSVYFGHP